MQGDTTQESPQLEGVEGVLLAFFNQMSSARDTDEILIAGSCAYVRLLDSVRDRAERANLAAAGLAAH